MSDDMVAHTPSHSAATCTNAQVANSKPLPDNDRGCFQGLIAKQEEHSMKIHKAVESLKPSAPIADTKTAFWNAYMQLADDYDKEFQQKYSTDLNTGLIFAGLFSAVSSAFIIQIQPAFTPGTPPPTTVVIAQSLLYISLFSALLASLLAVLGMQWLMYYQAAGSRGVNRDRGLERQRKLDGLQKWKFEAVLQTFPLLLQLALLLFATGLSVYLWTIHLSIAIIVLALTAVGFGLYLFLLGSAVKYAESPFQTPLTPFLIQLFPTIVRFIRWTFLGILVFITDIPGFIKSGTLLILHQCTPYFENHQVVYSAWYNKQSQRSPVKRTSTFPEISAVLWLLETSTDPDMIGLAVEMGLELRWPLDLDLTSPMARLYDHFQACFIHPGDWDLDSYQDLGKDVTDAHFMSIVEAWKHRGELGDIRQGMSHYAIQCGKLYCLFRLLSRVQTDPRTWARSFLRPKSLVKAEQDDPADLSELETVVQMVTESPGWRLDWTRPDSIHWALYIIPSLCVETTDMNQVVEHFLDQFPTETMPGLDQRAYTAYLWCLNALLSRATLVREEVLFQRRAMDIRVTVELDKSRFKTELTRQLFQRLQTTRINTLLVSRIIEITAQLMNKSFGPKYHAGSLHELNSLLNDTARFCHNFSPVARRLSVLVSAATLSRLKDWQHTSLTQMDYDAQDSPWIHMALQYIQQSYGGSDLDTWDKHSILAVESLLQLMIGHQGTPPPLALKVILRALSSPGEMSYIASIVLCQRNWWLNPNLQSLMQQYSVWSYFSRVTLKDPRMFSKRYIEVGADLVKISTWRPSIYNELPTWIAVYSGDRWLGNYEAFTSVIRTLWVQDWDENQIFVDDSEESWSLSLTALANVWRKFEFIPALSSDFIPLARCTVSTSLLVNYLTHRSSTDKVHERTMTWTCRVSFSPLLGQSLCQAAQNARSAMSSDILYQTKDVLERVEEFLEILGKKIGSEFHPGSGEVEIRGEVKGYSDWDELRGHFMYELNELEERLN
ncbi:hypothetical protein MVEN_02356200 [Mycena venus]|uniref:DUF6535 domain-containing protein n=1 Tax=Mycena venus TaxID=2733690 RepID=A0A8H6X373_9AGAR|nr:hypothetical protein MVEN_02356200 [Mycena venus]